MLSSWSFARPWLALSSPRAVSSSSSLNVTGQQQIKHVFVITLENENYATTFGANSKAPYLSQTLASQGAMVQQYYGTGHVSLDNYISMISGQAPTPETDNDCITYQDYKLTGTTLAVSPCVKNWELGKQWLSENQGPPSLAKAQFVQLRVRERHSNCAPLTLSRDDECGKDFLSCHYLYLSNLFCA